MEPVILRQHVKEQAVKVGTPQEEAARLQDLYEMISRRAYELFEARGYEHGHDLDDWFRAEAELLHSVRPKIHHTVNTIQVRTKLPGFRADQIQVSVEPWRVTLTGKKESSEGKKAEGGMTTERRVEHIYRAVDLPAEIEPLKATAVIKGDVLEVVLPKVEKFEANLKLKAA